MAGPGRGTRDITVTRQGRTSHERHVLRLYDPADVEAILDGMGFTVTRLDGYEGFAFPPGWSGFLATVPG